MRLVWYKSRKYQGMIAALALASGASVLLLQQFDIWKKIFPPGEIGTYWVFVIDTSRKMVNEQSGQSKLPQVLDALEDLMRGVHSTDQSSLLVFGHHGDPEGTRACKDAERLLNLDFWSPDKIRKVAQQGLSATRTGRSCLGYAVEEAVSELQVIKAGNPNSLKTVVIIAGGSSDCQDSLESLQRRLKQMGDVNVDYRLIGYDVPTNEIKDLQNLVDLIKASHKNSDAKLQIAATPEELKKAVHFDASTEPFLKRRAALLNILNSVTFECNKVITMLNEQLSHNAPGADSINEISEQLQVARTKYQETNYQFADLTQKDYREETRQIVQAYKEMRNLQEQFLKNASENIEAFKQNDIKRMESSSQKDRNLREQYNSRVDADRQLVNHLLDLERNGGPPIAVAPTRELLRISFIKQPFDYHA